MEQVLLKYKQGCPTKDRLLSTEDGRLNTENNVAVDVAANNAPDEDNLNVAVVAERVADVDLVDGHALAGPVVNVERVVDRASRARNPANAPDLAQDSDSDSDDDSIDVEAYMNRLSVGERVRLRHRVADRTGMAKIQRLCEKVARMQINSMDRAHDPTRIVVSYSETLMLVVMADWTNMCGDAARVRPGNTSAVNAGAHTITSAGPKPIDEVTTFKKGICRDATLFKEFKEQRNWHQWWLETKATAHA